MSENRDENADRDLIHMRACLDLARQAEGRTAPNPMVGAIVVSATGEVVGKGFHQRAGSAHAEVHALDQAGDKARGGTLYVNLEPCCHHGKTPPCSDRVTKSGVTRVVAAMVDPNPKVAGSGLAQIRDAGVSTSVGLLQDEAEWLNRGFLKRIRKGQPWLCLKLAVTLDARIADRSGSSRWITGPQSRRKVHELRDKYDAVLVGSNTLQSDDPELTVREIPNSRNPIRVALDQSLRVEPNSRFCATNPHAQTIIFASENAVKNNQKKYPDHIELVGASLTHGRLDLQSVLGTLASRGVNTVLCEGGGKLAGTLLAQSLVDEVYWIIAPKLLADPMSIAAVQVDREVPLSDAWPIKNLDCEKLGDDIWLHGIV